MSRRRLTDAGVKGLRPRATRYAKPDPELVGHYIAVQPTGKRSYKAVTRDPYGKQVWTSIGSTDHLTIAEAREKAREAIKRIKAGQSAFEAPPPKPDSFKDVAENWHRRCIVGEKKLRSADEIRRCLEKYIYPRWADREFASIRRSDIAKLLDFVADEHGLRMADVILATLSGVMHWHQSRVDDYAVPIARGMRRTSTKDRARSRIFSDDELRAIWQRAEAGGSFGALIQLLLLSAQRLSTVATMRWDHVDLETGVWSIPSEARQKGTAGTLVLPATAVDIIRRQPRFETNDHVFAGRAHGHIGSVSRLKDKFDAGLPSMPRWTLHDCRRTARSLLSRAGVRPDISERVLGHVQAGVQGIYDRHSYLDEKRIALAALAALVATIVDPPEGNVVSLARAASA
jgi:integrase